MYARAFPINPRLIIIALVSLVVIMLLFRPNDSANRLVSRWKPQELLTEPEPPANRGGAPPIAISGNALPVAGFDLRVADGLYPDERQALADELQRTLAYVSTRFGSGPTGRFQAGLMSDDDCGLHGIAYTDVRQVQVFTCTNIARTRAIAILAHEFVHQLEQDRYGPAHLSSDLILSEGTATWGAGEYWLGGQPDFRSYVRKQRQSGVFYALATDYNGLGIGAMNALYYQWASFVEFLIGTYGRAKFDQVYVTGHGGVNSADYQAIYGKSFDALEREWIDWLGR
jgi:hypothetical protein